ncbi:MAG: hypothetical protein COT67_02275 [Candidatus Tagabacteria bacterium CG09_land_8_20_14_0_10_41_14]|uniref:Peptidase M16 N-terminal domain-containing protein n=2 Tax=Candidatus Tagaibacteriota TaxID=1817918 RepID=A0A2H0WL36_9BACT|nr:MAG: hypothetical protein COT67_02275 [Candidatus Tagabacteria bacterium CG09_land_8_20_14_0_10_41_14]PJE72959.1 MAG: hypothetical protein COV00_02615 [Candidatus Tagabacteria bacterium CG10_big_fil_rev_8_21_14_0_10_40_13]
MKRNLQYNLFIKGGQFYEPKKKNGISHFWEHVVFSYSFFKSGFEKFLEENSIEINVETLTHCIWCKLTSLDNGLLNKTRKLIKKEITQPIIDFNGFNQEKRIIKEEISFRNQLPNIIGLNEFYKIVFKNSPLENPVVGTISSVNKIELDDLQRFHKNFCKFPETTEIIYDSTKEKINLLSNNIKEVPPIQIKQKTGTFSKNKNFSSKAIHAGWIFTNSTVKERIILDILRRILGGMSESFIYKHLLQKLHIIYSGNAFLDHYNGLDILFLQIFSTAHQRCLEEIKKLKKLLTESQVEQNLFKNAKQVELNYYKYPDSSIAEVIGIEFMCTGKFVSPEEKIKIIESITYKEFVSVRKKLLAEQPFILVIK